ncbi:hypothetical protein Tsp_02237 [Trichinella spiralis]|nr:hypothetical protein Tsp_02237 [Trichinella spiralis]
MLESDELICLSSHLLDSNTLRGLYKVDKVAFLSHLVGDMHISMVSRIVMSMARILIYMVNAFISFRAHFQRDTFSCCCIRVRVVTVLLFYAMDVTYHVIYFWYIRRNNSGVCIYIVDIKFRNFIKLRKAFPALYTVAINSGHTELNQSSTFLVFEDLASLHSRPLQMLCLAFNRPNHPVVHIKSAYCCTDVR